MLRQQGVRAFFSLFFTADRAKLNHASHSAVVPINYLIRRPPFRGSLPAEPSETEVVKALRSYASETLEVRMLGSASFLSVWYGTGKTSRKKDVGGYEVRRKDWEILRDHPLRTLRAVQWDERTVYMVSTYLDRILNVSNCDVFRNVYRYSTAAMLALQDLHRPSYLPTHLHYH